MMKKLILAMLVTLMTVDMASAQMAYIPDPVTNDQGKTTLSPDDNDDLAKRRRRRGRRGRGSEMGFVINPQLTLGIPMGDLSDQNTMGFGGSVEGLYFIDQLGIGLSAGYHIFGWADGSGYTSGSQSFLPILAEGVFIFSTEEFKPYAGIGVGLFNTIYKGDQEVVVQVAPGVFSTQTVESSGSTSDFGISPRAGFYYSLNDQMMLTGNVRYNMIFTSYEVSVVNPIDPTQSITQTENTTFSYLGIQFGLAFKLGG